MGASSNFDGGRLFLGAPKELGDMVRLVVDVLPVGNVSGENPWSKRQIRLGKVVRGKSSLLYGSVVWCGRVGTSLFSHRHNDNFQQGEST